MDAAGTPTLPDMNKYEVNNNQNEDKMDKIHLDGADYQAEPQVIAAYHKAVDRADGLEKELEQLRKDSKAEAEKLNAKISAAEGERDSYKERLDKAETDMPSRIDAAVKARLDIVGKATAAGVEVKADMADADIKKAVIEKVFPSANSTARMKPTLTPASIALAKPSLCRKKPVAVATPQIFLPRTNNRFPTRPASMKRRSVTTNAWTTPGRTISTRTRRPNHGCLW
jgi:hypothetical protein